MPLFHAKHLIFFFSFVVLISEPPLVHSEETESTQSSIKDSIELTDLQGERIQLFDDTNPAITIVLFIKADCPISNGYMPILNRLYQDLDSQHVNFVSVHSTQATTKLKAIKHAGQYSIEFPVAIDSHQKLARLLGANSTPQAFVLDKTNTIRYRGRIDNRYEGFGKRRPKSTRDDLRIAITEIVKGQPVTVSETTAIGCHLQISPRLSQR